MEVGRLYSVPDERLHPKVVGWTKQVYDKVAADETDAPVVAQLLGHSSVGGAFNAKVALMTNYGVAERRLGKIRITQVGRKIVAPRKSGEKSEGVKSALMNVALWDRLYQQYTSKGDELPDDFWLELSRICELPPDDAKHKSDWVARAYAADIAYLKSVEEEASGLKRAPATRAEVPQPSRAAEGTPETQAGQVFFVSPDDQIQLSVPRSRRHIRMLRTFIDEALNAIEEELVQGEKRNKGTK